MTNDFDVNSQDEDIRDGSNDQHVGKREDTDDENGRYNDENESDGEEIQQRQRPVSDTTSSNVFQQQQQSIATAATMRTKRRRRKINPCPPPHHRQHLQQEQTSHREAKKMKKTLFSSLTTDDDDRFSFSRHDGENDNTNKKNTFNSRWCSSISREPKFRSLLTLLEERRVGITSSTKDMNYDQKKEKTHADAEMLACSCTASVRSSSFSPARFQLDMTKSFTAVPSKPTLARRQWRPYITRKNSTQIPFTQLGTPPEDAVLALHRDGNFTVSIGPYDTSAMTSHGLAVRFHTLPTPHDLLLKKMKIVAARMKTSQQQQPQRHPHDHHLSILGISDIQVDRVTEDAPLLQTIPLIDSIGLSSSTTAENSDEHYGRHFDTFNDFDTEVQNAIFNFQRSVSPASTPVEFLLSHDWSIGICRLRPSSTSQWQDISALRNNNNTSRTHQNNSVDHDEEANIDDPYQAELAPVGSLVLFTMPNGRQMVQQQQQRYYRCRNVQVVSNAGMTTRNLLWSVNKVPLRHGIDLSTSLSSVPAFRSSTSHVLFDSYIGVPGQLFLNDEADGFRLTWITMSNESFVDKERKFSAEEDRTRPGDEKVEGHSSTNNVGNCQQEEKTKFCCGIITLESSWEEHFVSAISGRPIYPQPQRSLLIGRGYDFCASIVSEAYLHVDRILALILENRKGVVPSGQLKQHQPHRQMLPEFCYNLISIQDSGRVAQLLIAFLRPKLGYALGIFVDVDLFLGVYEERNWVQDRQIRDAASLHFWCTKLTMNRRMKQVRAGPYSLKDGETTYMDWTKLCREVGNINPDRDDDFDPSCWDAFESSSSNDNVDKKQKLGNDLRQRSSSQLPNSKIVSLASLYPCCDLVTNQALIDCRPVPSIRAKKSPIQLVYG